MAPAKGVPTGVTWHLITDLVLGRIIGLLSEMQWRLLSCRVADHIPTSRVRNLGLHLASSLSNLTADRDVPGCHSSAELQISE